MNVMTDKHGELPDPMWSFGRLHALSLAVVGCLALAALTQQGIWMWAGLAGALAACVWGSVLLYRDLHRARRN